MKKKLLINIVTILIISLSVTTIKAKEINSFEYELDGIRRNLEANQAKLTGMDREINAILLEIVKLDKEIEKSSKLLESVKNKTTKVEQEISDYNVELEMSSKVEEEVNLKLEKRLRYVYENGSMRKADLFFTSKSLREYFARYNVIVDILEYDKKLYTGRTNKKKKEVEIKQNIDKKGIELNLLKEDIEGKHKELLLKKENRESYIDKLKNNKEMLMSQNDMLVKQEEKLSNDLTDEIQKLLNDQRKASNIQPSAPNAQGFVWPFPAGGVVTAGFPNYPASFGGGRHDGFDIALAGAAQKELVAAKAGIVMKAVSNRPQNTFPYAMTYGNHVIIMHEDGVTTTLYGHMERVDVVVGQRVETGQVIGLLGNSGYSTGAHLHFEIRINGVPKNPTDYVSK